MPMNLSPTADDPALAIPPPPRARSGTRPRAASRHDWAEAVREASIAGTLTLAASWGLAELAFLLLAP